MQQQFSSALLEKAVAEFAKLPGVGRKTALRLVLLCSAGVGRRLISLSIPSLK